MKNPKAHIVFLTPGFAKSQNDSTTIPALQVYIKSLRESFPTIKITLVAFQFPFTKKKYLWHGLEVIPLNGQNKRLKKVWVWKKALKTLHRIHNKSPISVLHSFWIGECSFIGNRFSKKHKLKHITTAMGQDANLGNKYVKYTSNITIVTLSKKHKKLLKKNYYKDSVVIPWFLDKESFPKLNKNTIDILGVGALNTIKNYSEFINVIFYLSKVFKNLNVEIIGEGKLKPKLEKQIEKLGLSSIIKLNGILPRKKVLDKMAQSRVLLHTSTYESYGFVFAEALFSGMYVVSNNVGIATKHPKWHIANSTTGFTDACLTILKQPEENKKRVLLSKKQQSINSYIKLYNE